MKNPLVSIIMPTYNGEKYIKKALDSILGQNYTPIELIVVNDGSTDNTLKILESYKSKFITNSNQLRIISQKNGGVASAFNAGLKKFTGSFLCFLADDDWLKPDSVKRRVEFLQKNQRFDLVYCAVEVVDEGDEDKVVFTRRIKGFPPDDNLFANMLLEKNYYWGDLAHLVRSDYFLKIHPKRCIADFRAGQNIQIFLPLYYRGKVGYIDEPVATILDRQDSHSRKQRSEEEWRRRYEEIRDIYIDTLNKIDMPKQERENYVAVIQERYEKQFVIEDLLKEIAIRDSRVAKLKSKSNKFLGIKRSARLLVGNIKRRITRK